MERLNLMSLGFNKSYESLILLRFGQPIEDIHKDIKDKIVIHINNLFAPSKHHDNSSGIKEGLRNLRLLLKYESNFTLEDTPEMRYDLQLLQAISPPLLEKLYMMGILPKDL